MLHGYKMFKGYIILCNIWSFGTAGDAASQEQEIIGYACKLHRPEVPKIPSDLK